ncbi:hypothetical protein [Ammoniphilus resinae]|uniref:Uncharacterized protein n=1 Tax=Ammoniphilus resinae TaxID=861532 RepID=A0ABS4GU44_9BACL|nr:hypothetical protein [Ammoniphilus resinae]MBP1933796.1 hypothetical protein [Ammoniphilus resinae]
MKRNLISLLTLLFVLLLGTGAYAENRQADIEGTVEIPLAGVYKSNNMVRLNVHLKNNGEAFSGYMIIKQMNPNASEIPTMKKEITLQSGEEKSVHLNVPGENLNGQVAVGLVKRDMVVAQFPVAQSSNYNDLVIGVLSENPEAYDFLNLVKPWEQRNTIVKPLTAEDMPEESWILNNLDILALGEIPKDLTELQKEAIKEWVQSGGILIVSGGKSFGTAKASFGEVLPVTSTELAQRPLTELAEWARVDPPVPNVPALKELPTLFHTEDQGAGKVLVVAYDISQEPLATWQGNKEVWLKIFQESLLPSLNGYEAGPMLDMNYGVVELSYMIPGVTSPNLAFIALIWLLYIFIVSPVLYYYLKRKDKREVAWVVIPLLSIGLTAGVYFFGKYQVAKTDTTHTASMVNIFNDHFAKVDSAISLLMVNGGNYALQPNDNSLYIPGNGLGRPDLSNPVIIKENGNIAYENVPYLSTQLAYAKSVRNDVGSFETKLYVEDNRLKGRIQNNTALDLQDVVIRMGMQEFAIGALKKGQQMEIDHPFQKIYMSLPEPADRSRIKEQTRLDRLQSLAQSTAWEWGKASSQPILITGVSSDQGFDPFDVLDRSEIHHYSTLVRQQANLSSQPGGMILFPYGTLPARMGEAQGSWSQFDQNVWELSEGFINFALKVHPDGIEVKRVEIPLNEAPYKPFEKKIYNVEQDQWEAIRTDVPLVFEGDEWAPYMTSGGEIVLRFRNKTAQNIVLPVPYFQVEGEEKN